MKSTSTQLRILFALFFFIWNYSFSQRTVFKNDIKKPKITRNHVCAYICDTLWSFPKIAEEKDTNRIWKLYPNSSEFSFFPKIFALHPKIYTFWIFSCGNRLKIWKYVLGNSIFKTWNEIENLIKNKKFNEISENWF